MTADSLPYTILALTPYPGPGFPRGQRERVAVTFRIGDDPRGHTVWVDAPVASDDLVDTAIRAWITLHQALTP